MLIERKFSKICFNANASPCKTQKKGIKLNVDSIHSWALKTWSLGVNAWIATFLWKRWNGIAKWWKWWHRLTQVCLCVVPNKVKGRMKADKVAIRRERMSEWVNEWEKKGTKKTKNEREREKKGESEKNEKEFRWKSKMCTEAMDICHFKIFITSIFCCTFIIRRAFLFSYSHFILLSCLLACSFDSDVSYVWENVLKSHLFVCKMWANERIFYRLPPPFHIRHLDNRAFVASTFYFWNLNQR